MAAVNRGIHAARTKRKGRCADGASALLGVARRKAGKAEALGLPVPRPEQRPQV